MLSVCLSILAASFGGTAHLVPTDGATNDLFGASVAISGRHLLAGAPSHDTFGYLTGAAYAFEMQDGQWTQVQKLSPPVFETYGEFGASIDMQGDFAAVGWPGAMQDSTRCGLVILYSWTGTEWALTQTLSDPDGENGDRFGASICIDGDQLIIGCQLDDAAALNAGSALVYRRIDNSWHFEQRLVPSQGDEFSWAGRDVAIDGNIAVVGAYREWNVDKIQAAGAAYVFIRDADGTWIEESRLVAADAYQGNYFGYSVSLDGERLAIGSILNDAPIEDSGAVYLFTRDGGSWTQEKLSPPDVGGEFGYSVALQGDDLFVGAVYHAGPGYATGAVYRFELLDGLWDWRGKWLPLSGTDDCFYGAAISADVDQVALGAPRESTAVPWSGAVYVRPASSGCSGDLDGDVDVDVNDLLAIINAWGPCTGCLEDIDGNGIVGADDLLEVIGAWGWCK
ncbi:MAG: FG-GAP repeat protein [Phycisphaerales bacterium]|nr:FG-GAP repeat protein [Phycisphaerales bacterium]